MFGIARNVRVGFECLYVSDGAMDVCDVIGFMYLAAICFYTVCDVDTVLGRPLTKQGPEANDASLG